MTPHTHPEYATKADVKQIVREAVDAILAGMQIMFDQVNGRLDNHDERFDIVDKKLTKIENEVNWIKDDIKGIKADLSDTPSRSEFNKLKGKVDNYLPLNS